MLTIHCEPADVVGSIPAYQRSGDTGVCRFYQIVHLAIRIGVQNWLIKSAYTSIAASLIGGDTTHHIGGLTMNGQHIGQAAKAALEERCDTPNTWS